MARGPVAGMMRSLQWMVVLLPTWQRRRCRVALPRPGCWDCWLLLGSWLWALPKVPPSWMWMDHDCLQVFDKAEITIIIIPPRPACLDCLKALQLLGTQISASPSPSPAATKHPLCISAAQRSITGVPCKLPACSELAPTSLATPVFPPCPSSRVVCRRHGFPTSRHTETDTAHAPIAR